MWVSLPARLIAGRLGRGRDRRGRDLLRDGDEAVRGPGGAARCARAREGHGVARVQRAARVRRSAPGGRSGGAARPHSGGRRGRPAPPRSTRLRRAILDSVRTHSIGSSNLVAVVGKARTPTRSAQIANAFAAELVAERTVRFQSEVAQAWPSSSGGSRGRTRAASSRSRRRGGSRHSVGSSARATPRSRSRRTRSRPRAQPGRTRGLSSGSLRWRPS